MSRAALTLTIATPARVSVERVPIESLRAEDESGSFGIHAGHADLITLLNASIVYWRTRDGTAHYCAVDGGVLIVSDHGTRIEIACRDAVLGENLAALAAQVHSARETRLDARRRARVAELRLHAQAVRRIVHCLQPAASAEGSVPFTGDAAP